MLEACHIYAVDAGYVHLNVSLAEPNASSSLQQDAESRPLWRRRNTGKEAFDCYL